MGKLRKYDLVDNNFTEPYWARIFGDISKKCILEQFKRASA